MTRRTRAVLRAGPLPRRTLRVLALALLAASLALSPAAASGDGARSPLEEPVATSVVKLLIPGHDVLDEVADGGFDLAGNFAQVPNGYQLDAVVSAEEIAALERLGVRVLEPGEAFEWEVQEVPTPLVGAVDSLALDADAVKVGRVDYFTTKGQGFLSVEAKTSDGDTSSVLLDLSWDAGPGTPPDAGGTARMSRFVDSGVYMYHRLLVPVDSRPESVRVASSAGGVDTGEVSQWLDEVEPLTDDPRYRYDFVDGYMHPTRLYERIEELADEYPGLAEIVTLPFPTNGYRRKAQATVGSTSSSAVVVTSRAWGHEGGNDLSVEFVDPGEPGRPLAVEVAGTTVRVSLGTDATGALTSTAAQVAAALTAGAGQLVTSHTYRGNSGAGIVQPAGEVELTDFLQAPAEVSREPYPIRALRIGKHRDGSKTGVLIVAQDHAREWVPPLVALEAAERLLQNYARDAATRKIVDNADVFIVPSNNPDGSHYSFFDRAFQRRNMTNHCAENNSDPGRRNSWGVDLNRNYRVGSAFDGYSGASFSCTSDTFAGPSELSEPEAKNVIALVEANPHIKFFMTIHSNGGQLFWQPGAYIAEGRITTPRPEMRDEAYYWQMAERILSHVKTYQDTVVRPGSVGGSADVLYSSAGNVREDLYFNYGIYAFGWEVGGSVWDPIEREWIDGAFQPPWERGHGEAMEYASGVVEMFRIAGEFGKDRKRPVSELLPGGGTYSAPVEVRFDVSEPATIYYTTDGSRPTLDSSRYQASGIREGGESFLVESTTTFHWFSVDPAGNVERNYKPDGPFSKNYRKATITIRP